MSDIESLEVYQLATNVSDSIWELVNTWTQFERNTLGKELVVSVDSIGASIAEGFCRESYQDNIRCIYVAIGEFSKVEHWLKISYQRRLINDDTLKQIKPIMNELARRLNVYLNSIGNKNLNLTQINSL